MKYVKVSGTCYHNLRDKSGLYEVTFSDDDKYYFKDYEHHRLDGPAIICSDGFKAYYINDEEVSKEDLIKILSIGQMKRFLLNPENF